MDTTAQQHRITTGLYNIKFIGFKRVKINKLDVNDVPLSLMQLYSYIASVTGLILYISLRDIYELCFITRISF